MTLPFPPRRGDRDGCVQPTERFQTAATRGCSKKLPRPTPHRAGSLQLTALSGDRVRGPLHRCTHYFGSPVLLWAGSVTCLAALREPAKAPVCAVLVALDYFAAGGRNLRSIKDCSALQNEPSVSTVFSNPA